MHDLVSVAVFNGANDLLEQFVSPRSAPLSVFDNVFIELYGVLFKHHVDICLCGDDRVELDDVGMSQ